MNFLKKIAQEIYEATSEDWDLKDVIPVMTPKQAQQAGQAQSGQGQETKVVGQKETKKPQQGTDGDKGQEMPQERGNEPGTGKGQGDKKGQTGDQMPGDQGSSTGAIGKEKEGKGIGKGTIGKEKTAGDEAGDKGKTSDVYKPGKEWMDDHSKIDQGDQTGKSIIKRVYQESKGEYRRKQAREKSQGSGVGGFMDRVEDFIKEEFDISTILSRIGTFKRKLSELIKKKESHLAAVFNPVTQQTNIVSQGRLKEKNIEAKSAIMIMALDTSGSISQEEYKIALGYLNNIAKQFEKKQHGIDGEVYLLQWDAAVHPPLTKWKYINELKPSKELSPEEREQMKMKGGGGTDIQPVFDYLDSNFVKTIDGKDYFIFSDKMPALTGKQEKGDIVAQVKERLKPASQDYKEPSWKKGFENTAPGELHFNEGGFSNVPFLLIYTDGWFTSPNVRRSKLFANNPGNILYVVTDRNGIKNVRPKNYVYHDLHKGQD